MKKQEEFNPSDPDSFDWINELDSIADDFDSGLSPEEEDTLNEIAFREKLIKWKMQFPQIRYDIEDVEVANPQELDRLHDIALEFVEPEPKGMAFEVVTHDSNESSTEAEGSMEQPPSFTEEGADIPVDFAEIEAKVEKDRQEKQAQLEEAQLHRSHPAFMHQRFPRIEDYEEPISRELVEDRIHPVALLMVESRTTLTQQESVSEQAESIQIQGEEVFTDEDHESVKEEIIPLIERVRVVGLDSSNKESHPQNEQSSEPEIDPSQGEGSASDEEVLAEDSSASDAVSEEAFQSDEALENSSSDVGEGFDEKVEGDDLKEDSESEFVSGLEGKVLDVPSSHHPGAKTRIIQRASPEDAWDSWASGPEVFDTQKQITPHLQAVLWFLFGKGPSLQSLQGNILSAERGFQAVSQDEIKQFYNSWRILLSVPGAESWLLSCATGMLIEQIQQDNQQTHRLLEGPGSKEMGVNSEDELRQKLLRRHFIRLRNWLSFSMAVMPRTTQATVCQLLNDALVGRLGRTWPFDQPVNVFDLNGWIPKVCDEAVKQVNRNDKGQGQQSLSDRFSQWILAGTLP